MLVWCELKYLLIFDLNRFVFAILVNLPSVERVSLWRKQKEVSARDRPLFGAVLVAVRDGQMYDVNDASNGVGLILIDRFFLI